MTTKPSVEARLLTQDERWPTFKADLEAKRKEALRQLLMPRTPYEKMTRLAGEVSAYDYCLGRPAELEKSDPQPSAP